MNYPVWYLPSLGGGTLIAAIAILHVFISHFAVGGGLFLVLAEQKGEREKSPAILAFTKSHARFFLLVSAVLGGITGVGIWFIIALVNPGATSVLIHSFVFGWATEWVFFLVELVALFVYFYAFDRMERRSHLLVGWTYFIAAWLSLFLVNGIIDFMLTPGEWLTSGNFWDGFFNPTFWPSLFFRTAISFLLAGVYGFLTTAFRHNDDALKVTMGRFSARWVLVSLLAAVPAGVWYLSALPQPSHALVTGASPTIQMALRYGVVGLSLLILMTVLLVLRRPSFHRRPAAVIVMIAAFLVMGAFEWSREAARRPYVITGVMYSSGIRVAEAEELTRSGFLPSARWVTNRELHDESLLAAGEELFRTQCYACHTINGFNNDILRRTAFMEVDTLNTYLTHVHELRPFMPPFVGTPAERRALAAYIVAGLHGKPLQPQSKPAATNNKVAKSVDKRGAKLFADHCTLCHGGDLVKAKTAGWERRKIRKVLDNLNALNPAMPDYDGTSADKELMADYIVSLNAPAPTAQVAKPAVAAHDRGEDMFEQHCAMCHALRGDMNPLLPKVAGWDRPRIRRALDMLDKLADGAMPSLQAPAADKEALADFLYHQNQGR
jgi:mono/diheme cytochrome c family protein/cytochrome bd-type quinol oxidase subunit 1